MNSTTSTSSKKLSDIPEIADLQKKVELAKLSNDLQSQLRKAQTAQLPTSETEGKAGTVQLKDGAGYFAEILAFEAAQEATAELADRLGKGSGSRIVLTSETDLSARAQLWHLINIKLNDYQVRFDQIIKNYSSREVPAPLPEAIPSATSTALVALSALPNVLGAIADIAAFFRSNTQIFGRKVDIANEALLADLAREVQAQDWDVYLTNFDIEHHGALMRKLVSDLLPKRKSTQELLFELEAQLATYSTQLEELIQSKKYIEGRLVDLQQNQPTDRDTIQKLQQEIHELEKQLKTLPLRRNRIEKIVSHIDATLKEFEVFINSLSQGSASAPSPLEAVALIDRIKAFGIEDLLSVKIVSQGSEIHASQGAFKTRLLYRGGVILAFNHVKASGKILDSGTIVVRKNRLGKLGIFDSFLKKWRET